MRRRYSFLVAAVFLLLLLSCASQENEPGWWRNGYFGRARASSSVPAGTLLLTLKNEEDALVSGSSVSIRCGETLLTSVTDDGGNATFNAIVRPVTEITVDGVVAYQRKDGVMLDSGIHLVLAKERPRRSSGPSG